MSAVYDAGMLIAIERGDQAAGVQHDLLLREGTLPVVPAAVLAQVWRGGRQARLAMALHGCVVHDLDEQDARAAGALCAAAGTSDVVDASVVVAALPGSLVLTDDVDDLRALSVAAGKPLRILPLPL